MFPEVGDRVSVKNWFVEVGSKNYGKLINGVVVSVTQKRVSVCMEDEYKSAMKEKRNPHTIDYIPERVTVLL